MLRIDSASSIPVFQQIAGGIFALIAAGAYRPGDLIPSVRQQSLKLLVNPNTVQRAYEALERSGAIETRKGVGMVVTSAAPAIAARETGETVAQTLGRAIDLARSANLPRDEVDQHYQSAWTRSARTTPSKRSKP